MKFSAIRTNYKNGDIVVPIFPNRPFKVLKEHDGIKLNLESIVENKEPEYCIESKTDLRFFWLQVGDEIETVLRPKIIIINVVFDFNKNEIIIIAKSSHSGNYIEYTEEEFNNVFNRFI